MIGLINIQFAVFGDDELYVIEANPRASRTVPFVSKAVGVPLAKVACRLMLGERLADMALPLRRNPGHVSVKEAVLPFGRFPRADALLGPEMRSTGEVMGVASDYPAAFGKAQAAAGAELPAGGTVFISVTDGDKPAATQLAASLHDLGFKVLATGGTALAIRRMGVPVERIKKLSEGSPNVVERIEAGGVDLVINTPTGSGARADGYEIRRAAVTRGIPCITTMSGASAAQRAIRARRSEEPGVVSLQELHGLEPAKRAPVRMSVRPRRSRARSPRPSGAWPRSRPTSAVGAYSLLTALDADGPPDPRAGPVLHALRRGALGRRGRAALPAPRLLVRAGARRAGRRRGARLPARGDRPGHAPPRRAAGRGGAWAGRAARPAASARRRRGRPLLVGGGIGVAPLLCLSDVLGAGGRGAARLPLGRPRRGRRPLRRRGRRWRPTTARSAARAS